MLSPLNSRILLGYSVALLSVGTLVGQIQRANAFNITFDYTYDDPNGDGDISDGFFADSTRKGLLNEAASYFENNINDTLGTMVADDPGNGDIWSINFIDPTDGVERTINNETIAEGLKIFVGARDLDGNAIGQGGTGGVSVSSVNSQSDFDAATARISEASFWGGSLAFDTNTNWHFGLDEAGLDNNEADFLSTAIHEIAHVLGFGTSSNWNSKVSGTNFVGTKSQAIYGDPVPLDDELGHWNDSVRINGVETAMDPIIFNGTRKLLTTLDYAGLEDIGWDVDNSVYTAAIPFEFSPSLGIFLVAGMFGTKKAWNIWKKRNGEQGIGNRE